MEHVDENHDSVSSKMFDIDSSDPRGALVDRSALDPAQVRGISALMGAFARLREAEQELSVLSMKYMKLNQTDMRALHYLIVSNNSGDIATPGRIAAHLKISSASTPPDTHAASVNSVGRQQARRFHAAARLTESERETIIRFLEDMTDEITTFDETWAEA